MAIASLVLGIASLFFGTVMQLTGIGWIGIICGIVGIVLGVIAKKHLMAAGQPAGMAKAGFILSIIGLVLSCILFILVIVGIIALFAIGGAVMQNM